MKPNLEEILKKVHKEEIKTSKDVVKATMKIYESYLIREYNEGFQDGYEECKIHYGLKKGVNSVEDGI